MEVWKDVVGYEGLYEVSNLGRIRRNGRIKKPQVNRDGYMEVSLSKHSIQKTLKLHRIVAIAFIPNQQNKATVNHINGVKTDNRIENLEWATHSENIIHANKAGLRKVTEAQRKAASQNGKKTCDKNRIRKRVFLLKNGDRKEFVSAHEAARYVSGDASPIIRCCKGKMKTYKGYEWGYCDAN